MQLTDRHGPKPSARLFLALLAVGAALWGTSDARAESSFGATTTFFHEAGGELNMTVLTPSTHAAVDLGEAATISANYEADIVTGASVAVVDQPTGGVDVVTGATLDDIRHTVGGGLELRGEFTSLTAAYAYGFESDYRSHGIALSARAEMFERNTTFQVSYGRGFDQVCNLLQPRAQEAVDRRRLPNSDGCFGGEEREAQAISLQSFQGGWTQAWTPTVATQLSLSAQLINGYQGNPYRAVWLGRAAAQEFHPETRARYALGLGVRIWVKPLEGAAQIFGRAYRDTWGVESVTAEVAWEQNIFAGLSLRGRGRFYAQSGAAFYSDAYPFIPRGQFFTGDRELSPMRSYTLGGRLRWSVPADENGDVLGFLTTLDLFGKADYIKSEFTDFHYGGADVPNSDAIMATFGLEAIF